jgi:hypothetical protein
MPISQKNRTWTDKKLAELRNDVDTYVRDNKTTKASTFRALSGTRKYPYSPITIENYYYGKGIGMSKNPTVRQTRNVVVRQTSGKTMTFEEAYNFYRFCQQMNISL